LIATATVAAAGLGYSVYSGEKARSEAKDQARSAQARQDLAIKEAKAQEAKDMAALEAEEAASEKKADTAAMNLALRKKRNASSTSNRGGTILTSPLGIPGTTTQSSGKTLLGS
jgi:uncharacterized protein HemX